LRSNKFKWIVSAFTLKLVNIQIWQSVHWLINFDGHCTHHLKVVFNISRISSSPQLNLIAITSKNLIVLFDACIVKVIVFSMLKKHYRNVCLYKLNLTESLHLLHTFQAINAIIMQFLHGFNLLNTESNFLLEVTFRIIRLFLILVWIYFLQP